MQAQAPTQDLQKTRGFAKPSPERTELVPGLFTHQVSLSHRGKSLKSLKQTWELSRQYILCRSLDYWAEGKHFGVWEAEGSEQSLRAGRLGGGIWGKGTGAESPGMRGVGPGPSLLGFGTANRAEELG